jgi:hypothetical protein
LVSASHGRSAARSPAPRRRANAWAHRNRKYSEGTTGRLWPETAALGVWSRMRAPARPRSWGGRSWGPSPCWS